MKNKITIITIACLASISLTCCDKKSNPVDTGEITYHGINLHYNSSDDDMNTFLNDFTHRNMRYDSDSCGEYPVAHGTGFAKNWETMAVTFQNSVRQVYREDKIAKIREYLLSIDADDQGMVYNTPLVNESAFSKAGYDETGYSVPQGWPFPSWLNSVDKYSDLGLLQSVHTTEFNFNDGGHAQSKEWVADNGDFYVGYNDGYGHFSTNGEISSSIKFDFRRPNLNTLLPKSSGIDTRYSPMIDIELGYSGKNIKDYEIMFKVAGDNTWYYAPQSVYASTPNQYPDGDQHLRQFFDMYLHPNWNHQIVTDLGVRFIGKDNTTYQVKDGFVNFIRPTYDTRQANATYQFILAVYNYYAYTRDLLTLVKLMPKARRAMLFLCHALEGEKGLLSLEYLYGHDGVVPSSFGGNGNRLAYHGIGNGYSDLTVAPMINLEANNYFYEAIRGLAVLEEAMKDVEGDNPTALSVKNRLPYGERVYYNYTQESLNELADLVKNNMQKPVNIERIDDFDYTYNAGDYHYRNTGGLWNPETGRFVLGINEYDGRLLDYGHLYLNLESVCADIGTPEQQKLIMEWVDGRRTIDSDTSKGKDIYFYEFAPRFNTLDCEANGGCYGFIQDENFMSNIWFYPDNHEYSTWSRQVQNGGAVVAWSYYDLVARTKVFGIENAMNRLEEIKKWYLKILDYGGNGLYFYDDYYQDLDAEVTAEDKNMYMIYSIQASGIYGGGALGLDAEFIESIILIRSIPDALFGMDASHNNVMTFTYQYDKKHDFFEVYNLKYGDAVYSIRSKKNVIEVFNIHGQVDAKHQLTFRYKTDKSNLTVKVNGDKYQNVKIVDGYATITVPFGNVKVIFG